MKDFSTFQATNHRRHTALRTLRENKECKNNQNASQYSKRVLKNGNNVLKSVYFCNFLSFHLLPVMGLWLLSPGTQLSLTVRSYGSDNSKLVGGFGRSINKINTEIIKKTFQHVIWLIKYLWFQCFIPITIRCAEADFCSSSLLMTHV